MGLVKFLFNMICKERLNSEMRFNRHPYRQENLFEMMQLLAKKRWYFKQAHFTAVTWEYCQPEKPFV